MSNFNKEYIEHCERKIQDILNDEREYSDWTQICFSMKDAIHAAIEVWGISNEDEIHKMGCFIREMVFKEILNIREFDINFKKKRIMTRNKELIVPRGMEASKMSWMALPVEPACIGKTCGGKRGVRPCSLDCLVQIRKLELQDYLSPDVLEIENNEYYK